MITHINIKNFAVIEDTEVEFNKGLNIITGESGAGKSIVVEAMSLALGSRADASYIRTGSDKALIQMVCEYEHQEYIITRELSQNGKNICKINGEIVPLSKVQELASKVADIHGQYDNQSLLNPDLHIKLVDKYDYTNIKHAKENVSEQFHRYVDITKKINAKKAEINKYLEQKENIEFELEEITSANLIPHEDDELEAKLLAQENKEKIFNAFAESYMITHNEEYSCLSQLNAIMQSLKSISQLSKDAKEIEYELSDLYYRLEDTLGKITVAKDRISYSQDELDATVERLNIINHLKHKYGSEIDDILIYKEKLEAKLDDIATVDDDISSMQIEQERVGEMLRKTTDKLTTLRTRSCKALEEKLQKELDDLMFSHTQVSIHIEKNKKYTANGIDKVEFLISTNPGEPLKPLAKVASGGEMSRIMLAFKNVIGDYDGIGTMIFDEIDTGISGKTASIVGNKLKEIATKHQIIAITHLPQIAALGDHNYRLQKDSFGFTTTTSIIPLNKQGKIEEIARLLSAGEITDIAMENAKLLIGSLK